MTGERPGGWIRVEVKNRIRVGDEVEVLSPARPFRFVLEALEDPDGAAVSVAHGGNGCVWIRTPAPVEPYALLSRVNGPAELPGTG